MSKILITGATGFLGSHIAELLIANSFELIALKRKDSNCWRCSAFSNQIIWINVDENDWKQKIISAQPDSFIHCAWIGVGAKEREDLNVQVRNIDFLVDLLDLAKQINIKQFISLGSQAEYGQIDRIVKEEDLTVPTTAYGSVKVALCSIFKTFCIQNDINWIWLRLFSFFGERENENWLIPSIIKHVKFDKEIDLTPGLQKYAYMYVKDLSKIVISTLNKNIDSGIYNISSNGSYSIKEIVEKIKTRVGSECRLNFGKLPYRINQPMLIQGDTSKLINQTGQVEYTNFDSALNKVIDYYLNIYQQ